MKHTIEPLINALNAQLVILSALLGTNTDRDDIMIPIDPGFEKPHKAYVAITLLLGYK